MNLSGSPSDINILASFSRTVYRRCREVGGNYDDIGRDIFALHNVLKHLRHEVEAPQSPLNRDITLWSKKLVPVIGECHSTLRQVDIVAQKRERNSGGSSPSIQWENLRLGGDEKDQLAALKAKILSHKTSMTLFLDTIQLHSSENTMTILNGQPAQLDMILDKVDNIAAKMSRTSAGPSQDADDKERWKQFRAELVAEGFSYDVLQQHKDVLRAYIREVDSKGLPDETPRSASIPFPTFKQDSSDAANSATSSDDAPLSFESFNLNSSSDDTGLKERMQPDVELKFPQAMKSHIQRRLSPLKVPTSPQQCPPDYMLITPDMFDNKDPPYFNTDGSDPGTDSDSPKRGRQSRPFSESEVIKTSDLVSPSIALQLTPGAKSLVEGLGYFNNENGSSPTALQPTDLGLVTPSIESTPLFAQSKNLDPTMKRRGRPPLRLAPDSFGHYIPEDAQWTRIKRSLVSPEVLKQEGKRFEANPEYVAVLGVLTKVEVQEYAARSLALRESRRRRPYGPQSARSYQIPRPTPLRNGEYSPGADATSDSDDQAKPTRAGILREQQSYSMQRRSSYQHAGYPNPYGSPTLPHHSTISTSTAPAPPRSPPLTPRSPTLNPIKPNLGQRSGSAMSVNKPRSASSPKSSQVTFAEEVQTLEREPSRESVNRRRSEGGNVNKNGEKKGRKKWKENLSVAGIGGAAASMLNVLTEAAGI